MKVEFSRADIEGYMGAIVQQRLQREVTTFTWDESGTVHIDVNELPALPKGPVEVPAPQNGAQAAS